MSQEINSKVSLIYYGQYINSYGVLRHIPNAIKQQIENDEEYGEIIKEKINLAEEFIIYNILKLEKKPEKVAKAVQIIMEILCAILLIEYYIMLSPQVIGAQVEENGFRGTLIGRFNSLLKELKEEYADYTLNVEGMGKFEDSFIYKYIING